MNAFPLLRPLQRLQRERFDLLVIGGGIFGAWIAADAASRGAHVALVEARDWAAGTSSASSKLIHGGLRYLQQWQFGLVREALRERGRLRRLAPHLVQPLEFVLPLWRGDGDNPLKLRLGLSLYDWLAGSGSLAGHRHLSRQTLLNEQPALRAPALRGGFSYGDNQEDDARLVLEVVAAAQAAGAVCVSRLRAEALLRRSGGSVAGAAVHDELDGQRFELQAGSVVAAVGPWLRPLLGALTPPLRLIRGAHLVLPALPGPRRGLILRAPQDGRAFFVLPWYRRTLLGTTETEVEDAGAAAGQPSATERDYLLGAAAARLPGADWRAETVIAGFAGVRALQAQPVNRLSRISREFELLHPAPRLWVPLGGKYTTARAAAEQVVDALAAEAGLRLAACATAQRRLPGAPRSDLARWAQEQSSRLQALGVPPHCTQQLLQRYGTRVTSIERLLQQRPRLAAPLHPELSFIAAEALLAGAEEDVHCDDDLLRRRLPLRLLAPDGSYHLPEKPA
ncbi:MAG: glycerol-3-phosphate dehydrogenase/oxidase [Gammaproteobacteria bacterium]|nr:glycerol-3-phosphate dehydrogenase/oxidase [Gammaproteobacteria bacterium]